MARSIVSLGMLPLLASRIAFRKRALPSGSPPPERAATVISLINFVNSLPRLASSAPFLCLILCHFECPDIGFQILMEFGVSGMEIYHKKGFVPQSGGKPPFLTCSILVENNSGRGLAPA